MTAHRLERPESVGREIRLTRTESSTLLGFRRSAYAPHIEEILRKVLDDARIQNETEPSTELNRIRVQVIKETLDTLFRSKVGLE